MHKKTEMFPDRLKNAYQYPFFIFGEQYSIKESLLFDHVLKTVNFDVKIIAGSWDEFTDELRVNVKINLRTLMQT